MRPAAEHSSALCTSLCQAQAEAGAGKPAAGGVGLLMSPCAPPAYPARPCVPHGQGPSAFQGPTCWGLSVLVQGARGAWPGVLPAAPHRHRNAASGWGGPSRDGAAAGTVCHSPLRHPDPSTGTAAALIQDMSWAGEAGAELPVQAHAHMPACTDLFLGFSQPCASPATR